MAKKNKVSLRTIASAVLLIFLIANVVASFFTKVTVGYSNGGLSATLNVTTWKLAFGGTVSAIFEGDTTVKGAPLFGVAEIMFYVGVVLTVIAECFPKKKMVYRCCFGAAAAVFVFIPVVMFCSKSLVEAANKGNAFYAFVELGYKPNAAFYIEAISMIIMALSSFALVVLPEEK